MLPFGGSGKEVKDCVGTIAEPPKGTLCMPFLRTL
jgi:hypothetical protein